MRSGMEHENVISVIGQSLLALEQFGWTEGARRCFQDGGRVVLVVNAWAGSDSTGQMETRPD